MLLQCFLIISLPFVFLSGATPQPVVDEQLDRRSGCTANKINRALSNPKKSAAASAYCSTYIRSTDSVFASTTVTSTTQIPAKTIKVTSSKTTLTIYPTVFGTEFFPRSVGQRSKPSTSSLFTDVATYPPYQISSACSCLLTTQPAAVTETIGTFIDKRLTTTVTLYETTRIVPTPQCPLASVPTPGSKAYPLRVEGYASESFEGTVAFNPVYSTFGNVTTATGGSGLCDGTNGGNNAKPGNTPLNSLYNAAVACPFYLDGIFDPGRHEFYISDIGANPRIPDGETWTLLVDFKLAQDLACNIEVTPENDVVWAWQDLSNPANYFLKLTIVGPTVVAVGKNVTLNVIDGQSGMALEGSFVADTTTDSMGNAVYTCAQDGLYQVKADMPRSIRSNRVYFYCYTPGSGTYLL